MGRPRPFYARIAAGRQAILAKHIIGTIYLLCKLLVIMILTDNIARDDQSIRVIHHDLSVVTRMATLAAFESDTVWISRIDILFIAFFELV